MHNKNNIQEKPLSKQEYNRLYYQKNKNRWNNKKKEHSLTNVFHLFSKDVFSPNPFGCLTSRWISCLRLFELLVLLALVIAITCLLVRESASFYMDSQETRVSAYLKAAMIETIAILFSFSRGNHKSLQWAQKVVVVMLCGFTLWVMSGKAVKNAMSDTTRVETTKQIIQQLESELSQKEALQTRFRNRDMLSVARRYDKNVDQIRKQLLTTRQEFATLQSPQVIVNSLSILIAFRLLLVVANLICIHRFVEQLGALLCPKGGQGIQKRLNLS